MVAKIAQKVILIVIVLGAVVSAFAAYKAKQKHDFEILLMKSISTVENSENPQDAYLKGLSKEKTEFEKKILNLLSITVGDRFYFDFGTARNVDLGSRRAFFTNEAWAEYMAFIEREREELRQEYKQIYLEHPPTPEKPKEPNTLFYLSDFKPWSQTYKDIDGARIEFSSEGMRSLGYYDTRRYHQKFTLNIVIQGNLKDSSQFIIEKWQVNVSKQGSVFRDGR